METIIVMAVIGTLSAISIGQIGAFRQHIESIPVGPAIDTGVNELDLTELLDLVYIGLSGGLIGK